MSQRLETEISLNLAGNLATKARQYGNSMSEFAQKNKRAMGLVKASTAAAGKGIDRLGNRYVGMASAFATGATVRNVAAFEAQMTRIGTDAKLRSEQVDLLTKSIEAVANQSDVNIDTTLLASGVDRALGKSGDIEYVTENLRNMGVFMQAFGVDAQSSGSLFEQFRAKGVKGSEEALATIDRLYGQFAVGSVSVKELAGVSEKLFSTYQGQGPEAISQMGALLQLFTKSKGSADEAVTSIQAVFKAFQSKDKVELLNTKGIDVFKKGTQELREPIGLILEILDKAENNPLALGSVFDETALQGLTSLYSEENKQLLIQMSQGTVDLGATQRAAAKNAATLNSATTSLNNSFNKFANQRLAKPIKEIADAINSVDEESIQDWLSWGETAIWAIGGVVAAKKGLDLFNAGRRAMGGKGGGAGGLADLGAQPVYVVNMPASGFGGDISGGGKDKANTKKPSKAGAVIKGAAAATIVYPIVDAALDSLIGDTDFGKWAKSTTLGDVFGNSSDKAITKEKVNAYLNSSSRQNLPAYLTGSSAQSNNQSNYPTAQNLNLKIDVSDDRIKVSQVSNSPSLNVNVDNGIN